MTRAKQRAKKQMLLDQNSRRHRPQGNQPRTNVPTRSDHQQAESQDNVSFRDPDSRQTYASTVPQASHTHHQPPLLPSNNHQPDQDLQTPYSITHTRKNYRSHPATKFHSNQTQLNYFPQEEANTQAGAFAASDMRNFATITAQPDETNFESRRPLDPETGFEGVAVLEQRLQEFEANMMSKIDKIDKIIAEKDQVLNGTLEDWKRKVLGELLPLLIKSLKEEGRVPSSENGMRSDTIDELGLVDLADLENENH
ncbi:unnamed protein product [Fusarium langsethiae]|nr:unnamed protein product [Fusarium langsethiae]